MKLCIAYFDQFVDSKSFEEDYMEKICDCYGLSSETKLYKSYFDRFVGSKSFEEEEYSNYSEDFSDDWQDETPSYGRYAGSWAQDVEGYSDDMI